MVPEVCPFKVPAYFIVSDVTGSTTVLQMTLSQLKMFLVLLQWQTKEKNNLYLMSVSDNDISIAFGSDL